MNDGPIRIRAHHLLCMQGFQGYGYSDGFVKHLKDTIGLLSENRDTPVSVVTDCDYICKACPNRKEDKCAMDKDAYVRIKETDRNVLNGAGVREDGVYAYGEVMRKINEAFKNRGQLAGICDNCSWQDKCTWYMSLPQESRGFKCE